MKRKITYGFVVQEFNDDGILDRQHFVCGDQVEWENEDGDPIDAESFYSSFEMVQP